MNVSVTMTSTRIKSKFGVKLGAAELDSCIYNCGILHAVRSVFFLAHTEVLHSGSQIFQCDCHSYTVQNTFLYHHHNAVHSSLLE